MEVNENIFEGFSAVRMEVNENMFQGYSMTNETKIRAARNLRKQNCVPPTKKTEKTKGVSNDRSRHDDQNAYRIIKIGAILKG